jgi:hypothetical protein
VPPFWERTAIVGQAVGRIVDTGPPGPKVRKSLINQPPKPRGLATSGLTIMADHTEPVARPLGEGAEPGRTN